MTWTADLLAQLPDSYVYINPFKLLAFTLLFAIWALFAQWADKDAVAVNTYRVLWNLIILGVGALGMALGLLIPMFLIGVLSMLVLYATIITVYVVHRNGLVPEEDRVMTPTHFRKLREEGFSGKKKVKEVKERVRLTGSDGVVAIPEEEPAREQYRLTQDLMFDLFWRRAAIGEIAPAGQEVGKITYEIDGISTDGEQMPREQADLIIQYIKEIAGLNLEERRKPQRGEIMAAIGDNKHKVTIRTDGSTAGEKLTLRIIRGEANFKVPDLGFNPKQRELVEATREETSGLILLSGPSASGLTTSVYSFTRTHDRFLQNIQTLEYEVEMPVDNVTQHVFNPADGTTFAERLMKIVRSDPDIIVLPEVRDRESAGIAAKAAATKQKVYVALPATDIFDAMRKWIAAVGDKPLVAKSLLAVCNQRLVRTLCDQCKQAYKPDASMMRKLNLPADKVLYRPPEPEYDKHGNPIVCQACQGTGYVGRTGVFEWLTVDDGLRDVIRRSNSMSDIQAYASKKGGVGLQSQALQKVLDGRTSIPEIARVMRGQSSGSRKSTGAGPKPKPKAAPKPAEGGTA